MEIILPSHFSFQEKIGKDYVFQFGFDKSKIEGTLQEYSFNRVQGYCITANDGEEILISKKKNWSAHIRFDKVIFTKDFENINEADFSNGKYKWIKHPDLANVKSCAEVIESYSGAFTFKKENLELEIEGLRSPQIGGIYAVLAHWQIGNEPATIVMPTGTGKTRQCFLLLITANCTKVLIVVPSDALRSQLATKFITLGLLKKLEIVNNAALYPKNAIMKHRPSTVEEVNTFFENCNVVVTTMSVVGQLNNDIQTAISENCTHLFIDEAHHIAAKTWRDFTSTFKDKYILQFTATPFRNDDRSIGGKIVFNYPLKKAQDEGYYRRIEYHPIYEFNSVEYDRSIAAKQLKY